MKSRPSPRIRLPLPALLAAALAAATAPLFAERPTCFRSSNENSAAFTVVGNEATMNGIIDGNTPARVRALLMNHPEVDTIAMDNVPGSDNDSANVTAARLVRQAGLATHIVSNGVVSSGGVDFFLAGAVRSIHPSVCEVGVHSWSGGGVADASTLPRGDRRHLLYLSYYRDIGIGQDFYFFTLGAADADDIYNMDDTDLALFGMTGAAFTPLPPAPQVRVGKRANPSGRALAVKLRETRPAMVHFTAVNGSDFFDYLEVRGSRPGRGLRSTTIQTTGGRRNVTAALSGVGVRLLSVDPGEGAAFLTTLRAASRKVRIRQRLSYTSSSELTPSRRQTATVSVSGGRQRKS